MRQPVFAVLDQLGIEYRVIEHPPLFRATDEAQELRQLRGAQTKNLFVRDRNGEKHFLISVEASKKVDLQALRRALNCSKLSFGSEDRLLKYLGLRPGSVGPFGLINDVNRAVEFVLDEDLLAAEFVNFHPNENTATVELRPADFVKYIEKTGNRWQALPIPVLAD